jgi:Na+/serine symporter
MILRVILGGLVGAVLGWVIRFAVIVVFGMVRNAGKSTGLSATAGWSYLDAAYLLGTFALGAYLMAR